MTFSPLTCPMPLLRAHTLGLPLAPAWSALECAEREVAHLKDALQAVEAVLEEPCSQREVLRRLAGRFPVMKVKQTLEAGVRLRRLRKVDGPRGSHLYCRASS